MGESSLKYEKYRDYVSFIDKYKKAENASTGSKYDSNANVDNKNIATMQGEIPKGTIIGINRLLMHDKIREMYSEDLADEYIRQLESHEIYKHDETSIRPYTYSAKEVVIAQVYGSLKLISLEDLYELCQADEILEDEVDNVWCKYPANGDIKVADKNGYTNITRLVKKERHRDLVRVKTAFGEDLVVTDNHPLIVGENVEETIEAEKAEGLQQYRINPAIEFEGKKVEHFNDISPWNVYQYKDYYMSQQGRGCSYIPIKNSVNMDYDMGYFIGFFIGDGNYVSINGEMTNILSFSQKEVSVLERLANIAYTHLGVGGVVRYQGDYNNCWKMDVTCADLVYFLSNVCGIKHYAQYKTLPSNIFEYTRDFAVGIIDGLIDSDGTISSDGTCSIRLSSRTAIMQLTTLAHTLGISGGNRIQNTPFSNNGSYNTKYTIFGFGWKITEEYLNESRSYKLKNIKSFAKSSKYSSGWSKITSVAKIENSSFLNDNCYIYDLTTESHSFICNGIWVHNCTSITMYPFLIHGLKTIGGMSEPPKHLDSFCGSFINLVFAVASQFAGAVSTPEFLTYLDYFIRKEYGDDYYLHSEDIAILSVSKKTIEDVIKDKFAQVVYSLNQPAAARDFQSVFWNISYFDENYFYGIFKDFCFPDGTEPKWDSVSWLQKKFMKWFNAERLKKVLTFPVETMNLLDNGDGYVDEEWADFTAEMYSEGHSFFTYRSNSVDSLSSCCFDGSQKTLTRSSVGVNYMTFKDLYEARGDAKKDFKVFHNGSWVSGKPIRLPAKNLLKITTANNKELLVTVDHLNPTLRGDVRSDALTVDDYLLTNSCVLNSIPEKDRKLTYEQGFLIGMYLGDGSIGNDDRTVMLSLNKTKYLKSEKILNDALEQMGLDIHVYHHKEQHNVYPTPIHSREVVDFVREYVDGNYGNEKHLNLDCLMQNVDFRRGILDGYYVTDGGNSNRIYTTSAVLVDDIEALMTSLGLNSVINVSDRTDEHVVIRGETYKRNYPLYCIRWYERKNRRCLPPIYKTVNNSTYFKIKSIEPYESDEKYVYCFEMPEDEPYFTLPNGIITHNCRLKNEIKDNTFSFTLGAGGVSTGSKGVITMNVNRLVQNAVRSGSDISECVREQVDKIHSYLMAYNEIIKDYLKSNMLPVYNAGFIGLDRQYLTIGINGYVEGAEFLGIEISPNDEYFKYGETILRPIYESNRAARTSDAMFNTEFVPAENLGVKNAAWDKEDGYFVPRDCYNSYFYIVEDETCNVLDKFILHGDRLTKFLDGGSALHCNLDEHLSKSQYRKLMDVAIETGCSYFTYNIPNTICNKCGHITKHHLDHCEVCGSEDVDYITRIIGYLKRVSAFSAARQKEAKERYYAKP